MAAFALALLADGRILACGCFSYCLLRWLAWQGVIYPCYNAVYAVYGIKYEGAHLSLLQFLLVTGLQCERLLLRLTLGCSAWMCVQCSRLWSVAA